MSGDWTLPTLATVGVLVLLAKAPSCGSATELFPFRARRSARRGIYVAWDFPVEAAAALVGLVVLTEPMWHAWAHENPPMPHETRALVRAGNRFLGVCAIESVEGYGSDIKGSVTLDGETLTGTLDRERISHPRRSGAPGRLVIDVESDAPRLAVPRLADGRLDRRES